MKLNEYELKRLKKERMEEIDKWLDNEYGVSYTRLGELHDYFFEKYTEQKEEIERLKNIINNFEKWLEEQIKICQAHDNEFGVNVCNTFKDKLKGLKGDVSND